MKLATLLFCITAYCHAYSQAPGGKIYKPVKYPRYMIGQKDDTSFSTRKMLVLTDDHYFYYNDHTSGSCWAWVEAQGKWHLENDTLVFDWIDEWAPDSITLTTRYIVYKDKLVYIDPAERNIFRNWDNFILYKDICDFKTDLEPSDYITSRIRSYAAFRKYLQDIEGLSLYNRAKAHSVLTSRAWSTTDELLKRGLYDLTAEEIKKISKYYDLIWDNIDPNSQ